MQYSGILVTVRPEDTADAARRLDRLAGVEVHVRDEPSGRIVVVQEAPDVAAQMDGFRAIQTLPGVLSTELVYHLVDEAPGPGRSAGSAGEREVRTP